MTNFGHFWISTIHGWCLVNEVFHPVACFELWAKLVRGLPCWSGVQLQYDDDHLKIMTWVAMQAIIGPLHNGFDWDKKKYYAKPMLCVMRMHRIV